MDPLRPFTNLIRSLWASRSGPAQRASGGAAGAGVGAAPGNVAGVSPAKAVTSRLQLRLATLSEWNPNRARELFVESILLNELGEDLAHDPGFTDLVQKVSTYLANEPRVSARLDQVLRELLSAR
jgi:hypothetical protein